MSIIVKNMEMPETCMKFADGEQELCPFVNTDDDCILQDKCYGSWEEMHATCPLIEIPTPHGRLIDADELDIHDVVSPAYGFCVMGVTEEDIELADTVIEAEGETDGR